MSECKNCSKLTPDLEQTAARLAAQMGGTFVCNECDREYSRDVVVTKLKETLEWIADWGDGHESPAAASNALWGLKEVI